MVSVVGFLYGFRRGKERFVMVSVVGFFMVSGCYRTTAVSPMETVKKKKENTRTFPRRTKYIYIYIYTHIHILIIIINIIIITTMICITTWSALSTCVPPTRLVLTFRMRNVLMCMCVYIYITQVYRCINEYIYICIYVYIHTYIYIYVDIHIYICTCMLTSWN